MLEPSQIARRVAAKAIDLVGMGFTIVGMDAISHSYLAALLVGYAWLACSDWFGSPGKWVLGLDVSASGGEVTIGRSVLRNLPLLLVNLPHRLHQAILGLDRATYQSTHSAEAVILGAIELVLGLVLLGSLVRSQTGEHLGDRLAGTRVSTAPPARRDTL